MKFGMIESLSQHQNPDHLNLRWKLGLSLNGAGVQPPIEQIRSQESVGVIVFRASSAGGFTDLLQSG